MLFTERMKEDDSNQPFIFLSAVSTDEFYINIFFIFSIPICPTFSWWFNLKCCYIRSLHSEILKFATHTYRLRNCKKTEFLENICFTGDRYFWQMWTFWKRKYIFELIIVSNFEFVLNLIIFITNHLPIWCYFLT